MKAKMRIAVVGTYRSGSSAVAGVLHFLGVELGGPFWGNYYESDELAAMLRGWWREPDLVESLRVEQRRRHLAQWVEKHERTSPVVAAKHPLLSLSLDDLLHSWGATTRFLWCKRPIEQSIASLERCGWWAGSERIQRTLHDALEAFFKHRPCLALEFDDTLTKPASQIEKIASDLNLHPSAQQFAAAFQWLTKRST